jgi:hypothetical protein
MTKKERKIEIRSRAEYIVDRARYVRGIANSDREVDPKLFDEIKEALASLRHHCEMLKEAKDV